ncbi:MAG: restriction endonuclease subunit S [Minwuia sp.]|nr:restriction endonuclease subunit S [Minwuia sp.]
MTEYQLTDADILELQELTDPERPITYGVVKPGPEDPETGVVFIRGGDISNGSINEANLRTITQKVSQPYARTILRGGEVVMSLVGNPGQVAVVPDRLVGANLARQAGLIALRPEIYAPYIKYYLMAPQGRGELFQRTQGAVQQVINLSDLKTVKVRLPSRHVQERIADILSAYDDLIENNRRRITLLEEAARLLYREWFVHFRFPGHEHVEIIDGIPEGWERKAVADLADVYRGKSYKSSELVEDEGQPFINLKCFERGGGFRLSGLKWFRGAHKAHHLTEPGDIVIAVTDMTRDAMIVAQAARVPRTVGENAIYSMDLVKTVPKDGVNAHWFYGVLRFSRFSAEVREEATGSTVLHLKPKHIERWSILVPPRVLRELFSEQLGVILDQVDNLELLNEKLTQARDILLPRLMNGEVAL